MRFIIFYLVCCFSLTTRAQEDLKGVWTGTLTQGNTSFYWELRLDVIERNGTIRGTSFIRNSGNGGYGAVNDNATMNWEGTLTGSTLHFREIAIQQQVKTRGSYRWCIKAGDLNLERDEEKVYLKGPWKGSGCVPGLVNVSKEANVSLIFKGIVYDATNSAPTMSRVTIRGNGGEQVLITGSDGAFDVKLKRNELYSILVEAPGYLSLTEKVQSVSGPISKNFFLPRKESLPQSTTTYELNKKNVFENVLFVRSQTILLPGSEPELNSLCAYLKENPAYHIRVAGHTDRVGKEKLNRELSVKRAETIKRYFIKNGIASERITTFGFGSDSLVCNAPCEKNMRVEFTLLAR